MRRDIKDVTNLQSADQFRGSE